MRQRIPLLVLAVLALLVSPRPGAAATADTPDPTYLYKTTFVRAAPGRLLELIDLMKAAMPAYDAMGDEKPLWWRHTQGDQWDLMIILPMGSYAEYYAPARLARRAQAAGKDAAAAAEFRRRLDESVSWREDLFVYGPALDHLRKTFQDAAYYHVEIMTSLAGKRRELFRERCMESAYQVGMGRPEYMVFVRDQGASWDVYTLACYRDLAHWAESPALTKEQREEAARKAGFASPEAIGPYMRSLIDFHRDTMGVAIK